MVNLKRHLLQVKLVSSGFDFFGTYLPSFGTGYAGSMKVIFTMAFGSLFGDMFMSFFKRRIGLKRGAPLPVVDQLDCAHRFHIAQ